MSAPKPQKSARQKVKRTNAAEQEGVAHERIRDAAYYKWQASGCPCTDGVDFWLQAEAELTAETPQANQVSKG